MDKTTDRKETDRKQILFTEGAKGGARRKLELDLFYLSLDLQDGMGWRRSCRPQTESRSLRKIS